MKALKTAAAVAAVTILAAGTAVAQPAPDKAAENTVATKVYHAGGRHDQKLHEAAVRARANGQRMTPTTVHAGGRHDARAHEAAMKAEAKRASGDVDR